MTDKEFQDLKDNIEKQLHHMIADRIQELKEKAVCKPGEEPLIRVPVAEIEIMGEKVPIVYMLGTQWSVYIEIKAEWNSEARGLCQWLIQAYNSALISFDAQIKMTGNYHDIDIKASEISQRVEQIASAYRELSDHVGPIKIENWQVDVDWGGDNRLGLAKVQGTCPSSLDSPSN